MKVLLQRLVRSACLGAAIAAVGTVAVGVGAGAQDSPLESYTATAAANGVRIEFTEPGAPLNTNVFDGGAPVAQATVNGLGTSTAVASMPYPSENAVTLPGTVFPLVGLPAPPAYPLLVTSAFPNEPRPPGADGAISLHAESNERSSTAEGGAGGSAGLNSVGRIAARATAAVDDETSDVVAEARSSAESVTIAGVLTIGSVVSTAKAVASPSGTPTFESSFVVDGARTTGLALSVTNAGIVLPGTTVPIQGTEGLSPVLDALHVSLEYLPARTFDDGVMSAGLSIRVPTPATQGTGTITMTFGRVIATTASSTAEPAAAPSTETDTATSSVSSRPSSGASGIATGAPRTSVTPSASPISTSGDQPAASEQESALVTVRAASFYLMLVLGAAVAVVVTSLLRLFGVRLAWIG